MDIPQPLFSLISCIGREGIWRDLLVHLPLGFPFQCYIWLTPDKHIFGYSIWAFGLQPHVRNSWKVWNCFQKTFCFQQQFPFAEPMGWDGWKAGTGTILSTPFLCLILFQKGKHHIVAVEGQDWGSLLGGSGTSSPLIAIRWNISSQEGMYRGKLPTGVKYAVNIWDLKP